MFTFKFDEIGLPGELERVELGKICEEGEEVSKISLERTGDRFFIETAFAAAEVNWGQPEKPVDQKAIRRSLFSLCRFIKKHHDRFSRVHSAA